MHLGRRVRPPADRFQHRDPLGARFRRKPGTILASGSLNGMLNWALTCLIVILVEVVVSFSEARVRVRWILQSLCVLFLILLLLHTLVP